MASPEEHMASIYVYKFIRQELPTCPPLHVIVYTPTAPNLSILSHLSHPRARTGVVQGEGEAYI